MRLLIDCFKLVKGQGKSIGIYNLARNLVVNLAKYKLKEHPEDAELLVLGNEYNRPDFDVDGVEFIPVKELDPRNKIHAVLWELFAVSSYCRKYKADRVLFPRGYCALSHPVGDIIIIHDLIPFYYHEHFPGVFNRLENAYIMNRLRASAKTCRRIVAVSEYSRADIAQRFHLPLQKIRAIHNGCNPIYADDNGAEDISLSLPDRYICSITGTLPHKNAEGVIRAYEEYCKRVEEPYSLVIIGLENTDAFSLDTSLREKIICFKYLEKDSDMHRIVQKSRAFVFLSLIEGFGFPPIEAMQLKVPVVCSNTTSLPEVVGDAAILADPEKAGEAAEAIQKTIEDEELRSRLIAKGLENVKRFAWEKQVQLYWKALFGTKDHQSESQSVSPLSQES